MSGASVVEAEFGRRAWGEGALINSLLQDSLFILQRISLQTPTLMEKGADALLWSASQIS